MSRSSATLVEETEDGHHPDMIKVGVVNKSLRSILVLVPEFDRQTVDGQQLV